MIVELETVLWLLLTGGCSLGAVASIVVRKRKPKPPLKKDKRDPIARLFGNGGVEGS